MPDDPWDDLFPERPLPNPPGEEEMLRLIAYDIANDKRLRKVAEICEDFGLRVQKSIFECWLEDAEFQRLWTKLAEAMDPDEDKIAAYSLDAAAARRRLAAGFSMVFTEKAAWRVF